MDISEIQGRLNADLEAIKQIYRDDLFDYLHFNIKDVFDDAIGSFTLKQSNQCYDDERYYFGVANIEFYDADGKYIRFYSERMIEVSDFVHETIESNSDVFQLIFGKNAELIFTKIGGGYNCEFEE